ncbi:unnamed protein product [Sympodiomycopsis kandeliae]
MATTFDTRSNPSTPTLSKDLHGRSTQIPSQIRRHTLPANLIQPKTTATQADVSKITVAINNKIAVVPNDGQDVRKDIGQDEIRLSSASRLAADNSLDHSDEGTMVDDQEQEQEQEQTNNTRHGAKDTLAKMVPDADHSSVATATTAGVYTDTRDAPSLESIPEAREEGSLIFTAQKSNSPRPMSLTQTITDEAKHRLDASSALNQEQATRVCGPIDHDHDHGRDSATPRGAQLAPVRSNSTHHAPSSSSSLSYTTNQSHTRSKSRILFAPTVKIGHRAEQAAREPESVPASTDAPINAVELVSSRRTRKKLASRPQTAPQDRDGKFDSVQGSRPRPLIIPTSWKHLGRHSRQSSAAHNPSPQAQPVQGDEQHRQPLSSPSRPFHSPSRSIGFPDGFVSAPLHPAGPFGGDLSGDMRAISPALPENLPPPPRFFVPGTLILVRDEALWRSNVEAAAKETTSEQQQQQLENNVDDQEVREPYSTLERPKVSQLRRHSLPIEASLPSETASPSGKEQEGSENISESLRLLDSRLNEVSERNRALNEAFADVEYHSSETSPTWHSVKRQNDEPTVLWHGEAPQDDPPRAQKRKIPFRAVAIAVRSMKRFFHSSDKSTTTGQSSEECSRHRRRQSVIDELLHGPRPDSHSDDDDYDEEKKTEAQETPEIHRQDPSNGQESPLNAISPLITVTEALNSTSPFVDPLRNEHEHHCSCPSSGSSTPNLRRRPEPPRKSSNLPVRIISHSHSNSTSADHTNRSRRSSRLTSMVGITPSRCSSWNGPISPAPRPAPPSILVISPKELTARATPWEVASPNYTPDPELTSVASGRRLAEHQRSQSPSEAGVEAADDTILIHDSTPTPSMNNIPTHQDDLNKDENRDPDEITILSSCKSPVT